MYFAVVEKQNTGFIDRWTTRYIALDTTRRYLYYSEEIKNPISLAPPEEHRKGFQFEPLKSAHRISISHSQSTQRAISAADPPQTTTSSLATVTPTIPRPTTTGTRTTTITTESRSSSSSPGNRPFSLSTTTTTAAANTTTSTTGPPPAIANGTPLLAGSLYNPQRGGRSTSPGGREGGTLGGGGSGGDGVPWELTDAPPHIVATCVYDGEVPVHPQATPLPGSEKNSFSMNLSNMSSRHIDPITSSDGCSSSRGRYPPPMKSWSTTTTSTAAGGVASRGTGEGNRSSGVRHHRDAANGEASSSGSSSKGGGGPSRTNALPDENPPSEEDENEEKESDNGDEDDAVDAGCSPTTPKKKAKNSVMKKRKKKEGGRRAVDEGGQLPFYPDLSNKGTKKVPSPGRDHSHSPPVSKGGAGKDRAIFHLSSSASQVKGSKKTSSHHRNGQGGVEGGGHTSEHPCIASADALSRKTSLSSTPPPLLSFSEESLKEEKKKGGSRNQDPVLQEGEGDGGAAATYLHSSIKRGRKSKSMTWAVSTTSSTSSQNDGGRVSLVRHSSTKIYQTPSMKTGKQPQEDEVKEDKKSSCHHHNGGNGDDALGVATSAKTPVPLHPPSRPSAPPLSELEVAGTRRPSMDRGDGITLAAAASSSTSRLSLPPTPLVSVQHSPPSTTTTRSAASPSGRNDQTADTRADTSTSSRTGGGGGGGNGGESIAPPQQGGSHSVSPLHFVGVVEGSHDTSSFSSSNAALAAAAASPLPSSSPLTTSSSSTSPSLTFHGATGRRAACSSPTTHPAGSLDSRRGGEQLPPLHISIPTASPPVHNQSAVAPPVNAVPAAGSTVGASPTATPTVTTHTPLYFSAQHDVREGRGAVAPTTRTTPGGTGVGGGRASRTALTASPTPPSSPCIQPTLQGVKWKSKVKISSLFIAARQRTIVSPSQLYLVDITGFVRDMAFGEAPCDYLLSSSTALHHIPSLSPGHRHLLLKDPYRQLELYDSLRDQCLERKRERELAVARRKREEGANYKPSEEEKGPPYGTIRSPVKRNDFLTFSTEKLVTIRFSCEYHYVRFLFVLTSVMGYDMKGPRPYKGFPPLDPRNQLSFAPLPTPYAYELSKVENYLPYIYCYGNLLGRDAEGKLQVSLKNCFLCVTNNMVMAVRMGGTIPSWLPQCRIQECYYNTTIARPFIALLSDDGEPDYIFSPSPPDIGTFLPEFQFSPAAQVQRLRHIFYQCCFSNVEARRVISFKEAKEHIIRHFVERVEQERGKQLEFRLSSAHPSAHAICPSDPVNLREVWHAVGVFNAEMDTNVVENAAVPLYDTNPNNTPISVEQLQLMRSLVEQQRLEGELVGLALESVTSLAPAVTTASGALGGGGGGVAIGGVSITAPNVGIASCGGVVGGSSRSEGGGRRQGGGVGWGESTAEESFAAAGGSKARRRVGTDGRGSRWGVPGTSPPASFFFGEVSSSEQQQQQLLEDGGEEDANQLTLGGASWEPVPLHPRSGRAGPAPPHPPLLSPSLYSRRRGSTGQESIGEGGGGGGEGESRISLYPCIGAHSVGGFPASSSFSQPLQPHSQHHHSHHPHHGGGLAASVPEGLGFMFSANSKIRPRRRRLLFSRGEEEEEDMGVMGSTPHLLQLHSHPHPRRLSAAPQRAESGDPVGEGSVNVREEGIYGRRKRQEEVMMPEAGHEEGGEEEEGVGRLPTNHRVLLGHSVEEKGIRDGRRSRRGGDFRVLVGGHVENGGESVVGMGEDGEEETAERYLDDVGSFSESSDEFTAEEDYEEDDGDFDGDDDEEDVRYVYHQPGACYLPRSTTAAAAAGEEKPIPVSLSHSPHGSLSIPRSSTPQKRGEKSVTPSTAAAALEVGISLSSSLSSSVPHRSTCSSSPSCGAKSMKKKLKRKGKADPSSSPGHCLAGPSRHSMDGGSVGSKSFGHETTTPLSNFTYTNAKSSTHKRRGSLST